MCGRYTFFPGEFSDLRLIWKVDDDIPLLKPRYNIAPSQEAPVIVQPRESARSSFFNGD
jgi:putative SOS response-associated peptidase YedK